MKKHVVNIGIIASLLPHIFCCGLPIVLSVLSLFAPEVAHNNIIIPQWLEPWIFVFSALMLGLSWVLIMRDCHCACDDCHGHHSHHAHKVILGIVTIVFIASVLIHVASHH